MRIYRAVSSAELADIKATGAFRFAPNGSEMKQFWVSAGDAQAFLATMNNLLGASEYHRLVTTNVLRSTFAAEVPGTDPLNGRLRPYVTFDMLSLLSVNADARRNGIREIR